MGGSVYGGNDTATRVAIVQRAGDKSAIACFKGLSQALAKREQGASIRTLWKVHTVFPECASALHLQEFL